MVGRFRWTATHGGEFMGVPATGRRISIEGIGILRIVDGRMVERWNVTDVIGLLATDRRTPRSVRRPVTRRWPPVGGEPPYALRVRLVQHQHWSTTHWRGWSLRSGQRTALHPQNILICR